ncbi:MAG: citrate (Si)-synthase [candidate division Zixibacteria bacterium]|nr:citrate (Si)-synthase [candidate division Zixibacteria bacterium]
MSKLKAKFESQIPGMRTEIRSLIKEHGSKVISEVTLKQVYGGMRGVRGLVCDTSLVPPEKGLIIRGIPLNELFDKIPEEIFWLLVTGELPTADEVKDLQAEYTKNAGVPDYVWKVLEAMPEDAHPMCMLDTAILAMEGESEFRKNYAKGMKKEDYWEPMMQDSIRILAVLPEIAAGVYRLRYKKGPRIASDPNLDWGADYANMLGIEDSDGNFAKLMRLYLTLHCDHEGGNVSAHACHCIGSALSDAYYSISGGLNGLAGPLHGLANQECLKWVLKVMEKFGGAPSNEDLEKFAWDTLNSGQVIPGYGHAVLRITDPRFDAFLAFGKEHCAEDPVFQTVSRVFDVVPGVLRQVKKIADPWPNVDAGSGALLYKFGLKEFEYYTVLFSVSRAMGMASQLIVSRAWGEAIERPKSSTTEWLKAQTK